MRRRPRPQLDAAGNLLAIPANLTAFDITAWPGTSDHHRWEQWHGARLAWAIENDAPDDIMLWTSASESQPNLTPGDIARLI